MRTLALALSLAACSVDAAEPRSAGPPEATVASGEAVAAALANPAAGPVGVEDAPPASEPAVDRDPGRPDASAGDAVDAAPQSFESTPPSSTTAPEPADDSTAERALAILRERCVECHGPEKKKGRLRLDTPRGIASVVTPGDPEDSELVRRVSLPPDDLDIMPADETTLTPEEIAVLRDWVAAGAQSADVAAEADARLAREAELEALRAATRCVVVAADTGLLRVDASRGLGPLAPEALAPLAEHASRIAELSLAGRSGVGPALRALPELPVLTRLGLERSDVEDAALRALLARTPALRELNVHSTRIGDAAFEDVEGLALERVHVADAPVGDATIAALRARGALVVTALELPEPPEVEPPIEPAPVEGENAD